jgi:hypothetical protein
MDSQAQKRGDKRLNSFLGKGLRSRKARELGTVQEMGLSGDVLGTLALTGI